MPLNPVHILMIEDNPADVALTKAALASTHMLVDLEVLDNGESALQRLRGEGSFAGMVQPDLILLDLNLPGMGGREVLSAIRADAALTHLPVVILTTSSQDEDVLKSYQLHANCFITKPPDIDQFKKVVESLNGFWFTLVRIPKALPAAERA